MVARMIAKLSLKNFLVALEIVVKINLMDNGAVRQPDNSEESVRIGCSDKPVSHSVHSNDAFEVAEVGWHGCGLDLCELGLHRVWLGCKNAREVLQRIEPRSIRLLLALAETD